MHTHTRTFPFICTTSMATPRPFKPLALPADIMGAFTATGQTKQRPIPQQTENSTWGRARPLVQTNCPPKGPPTTNLCAGSYPGDAPLSRPTRRQLRRAPMQPPPPPRQAPTSPTRPCGPPTRRPDAPTRRGPPMWSPAPVANFPTRPPDAARRRGPNPHKNRDRSPMPLSAGRPALASTLAERSGRFGSEWTKAIVQHRCHGRANSCIWHVAQ
jgi:hypothetical protein